MGLNNNPTGFNGYRYGFNGMEMDDEVSGNGNSYDFGARIYDPRVARFFSTDSKESEFPWQSPYLFASNSPIRFIDLNGENTIDPSQIEQIKKKVMTAKEIQFTLYVDQPGDGGDRDTHEGRATGHIFIGMKVIQEDGSFEEIVMGFYPTGFPVPGINDKSDSEIGDDSDVEYNVILMTKIDKEAAITILDYTKDIIENKKEYDLQKYNCSDYGVECAKKAGLEIKDTEGKWPGGKGTNPGGLGEDTKEIGGVGELGYSPKTTVESTDESSTDKPNKKRK